MSNILTDEQEDKVVIALANGQTVFTAGDVDKVLTWARQVVLDTVLFDMAISGKLVLSVENGEVNFQTAPLPLDFFSL